MIEDEKRQGMPLKEVFSYAGLRVKKGEWMKALVLMNERIRDEEGEGPHPKPKNPIWKAAYQFLKNCETGDVNYIKELANRLDGLPGQSITVDDKRSLEELSDAELDAATEALTAILTAKDSAAGTAEASEVKPADAV